MAPVSPRAEWPARGTRGIPSVNGLRPDAIVPRAAAANAELLPVAPRHLSAPRAFNLALKRFFDIAVGSLALIGSLPLLMISSLLILLEDGAPVLFVQTRVGQSGRLFRMLKLRTMLRGADGLRSVLPAQDDPGFLPHKTRADPRVTRLGRILRRLSIDELPQLVNVLLGDMSLVGPRPELPEIVDTYEPWQLQRLSVPQGMTGWWQVSGRGERPMHLHTQDDLYYIRNLSFRLDLEILVRTVWIVLEGRGAY